MAFAFKALTLTAALASGAMLAASPAAAQDKSGEKVNMVIAYSEEECPDQTSENEIVVCQILVESERYRIPSSLRLSDSPENVSRVRQVEQIKYVGDFGAFSCSPAGAGGFTGCTQKFIESAYEEKEQAPAARFSELIEQARQERLSSIDEDTAAEQARVEQIEREYLERLERERDALLPGESETPAIVPSPDAPPVMGPAPGSPAASSADGSKPAKNAPVVGPTLADPPED